MSLLRRFRADLICLSIILALALLWFAPVLLPGVSGRTLLPYDNLSTFEPWRTLRSGAENSLVPHNALLSDLVLENAVWKLHIRRSLADGEIPLWNPQIFTGVPFLAAGQASTFYPLSILFYVLPLEVAYGWFTALQIALAGANLYLLARALRVRPAAALLGGAVYMFSGFLIVSVVFTMFIAAAAWLPLVLAAVELIIRKQEEKGRAAYSPIPYVLLGAAAVGLMVLAGHPELIYYTALAAAGYAGVRLVALWRLLRQWAVGSGEQAAARSLVARRVAGLAIWIALMGVAGVAGGGVQLLPLLELLPLNFRVGSASYAEVVGWAWPSRHVLTFALPDAFGNPSHHRWFDIWNGQWVPATVNALGEANDTIFWGIKNYVEGGAYLGLVPWILAAVALVGSVWGAGGRSETQRVPRPYEGAGQPNPRRVHVWFFATLAVVSLLFAFGTPLYALLFYGLPGWNQLHSPFRWVFPFTVAMSVLAALGLETLLSAAAGRVRLVVRVLAMLTALAGIGALLIVLASTIAPENFVRLGQRIVDSSDLAQPAFADGRMFWSYQASNLARFGLFALAGAAAVWAVMRLHDNFGDRTLAIAGLIAVVALDLYAAHGRFNPAAPVELSPLNAEEIPPAVEFIHEREGLSLESINSGGLTPLWRFTTFNGPDDKTFNANVGMYYGWHDVRGYDSIIPRQYVALMDRIAPQANELLYNRIAPIYTNAQGETYVSLDNPLLDLLNVKYVLTEHYIPNPKWREVYRDETLGVYENGSALPRTFLVPAAETISVEQQPLGSMNPRGIVYLDAAPTEEHALEPSGLPEAGSENRIAADARISRYTANEVFVDVNVGDRGWLVLTDAYFPGWKAYLRPFGAPEGQEEEINLYRAYGAFRAVYLPQDGQWTVRFVYSPMSFKVGLYTSFLAGMALLLLSIYWLWGRYYRPETTAGEAQTVAKNSLVPMALNLFNKVIDFAFAMLYVRILGPAGTGQYAFVVALYGLFEIISRYGLGTLLTRDVAADKNQSSRYLTNVLALRTLLWLASLPLLALVTYGYSVIGQVGFFEATSIGPQEVQAIAIFALAMLFANWADAFSSMFYAFEKMEYPAGLANAVAILKVALGALVLLLGWGFVGLAAVSLVMNIAQLFWLYVLMRSTLFPPEWKWDWSLQKWMARSSGPLMINHLLATIFWRIDVWILRPLSGAVSVGLYSVGLKYIDGLNIVPSVFTMAVFPLMSRYARAEAESGSGQWAVGSGGKQGAGNETRGNLLRAYVVSLRLLVMVSVPIAVVVTLLARPLVWLVGGGEYLDIPESVTLFGRTWNYLGGSDLALQVIIWSIPIGFVNSVTQYVLIAVDQQRYLTRAFVFGVVFNIVGNLIAIPRFGYLGAAVVTILSEFSLLFPFYASVRRHVGRVPWFTVFRAPVLAAGAMALAILWLNSVGVNVWFSAVVGGIVYLVALVPAGAFAGEEMAIVRRWLPLPGLLRAQLGQS